MRSLIALTMIVLLATVSSCTATGEDHAGTTTTVSMNGSLDELQAYFNQHQGRLRFVTLLSPT